MQRFRDRPEDKRRSPLTGSCAVRHSYCSPRAKSTPRMRERKRAVNTQWHPEWPLQVSGFAGVFALLLGVVVLAGWSFGIARIVSPKKPGGAIRATVNACP